MKFTIEAETLCGAVKRAGLAAEKRSSIPILMCLTLTAANGAVTVFGTDMDREIADTVPATVEVDGAIAVDAKALAALSARFAKGSLVEIELVGDKLAVRNGCSSTSLNTQPATDAPRILDKERSARFILDAAVLAAEIGKVRHAIPNNEPRYYLNGVYWHIVGGKLRMVATDGHRLALSSIRAPIGSDNVPDVIVPRGVVDLLYKLTSGKARPAVYVEVGDAQLQFTIGGMVLRSTVVDSTFPEYERVIPTQNGITVSFDRGEAAAAIGRLIKATSGRVRAIKFDATAGSLGLSVTDPDCGDMSEAIDARVSAPITIGFNGRYVLDALKAGSGDYAEIQLCDAQSPAVIREGELTQVIMPMSV